MLCVYLFQAIYHYAPFIPKYATTCRQYPNVTELYDVVYLIKSARGSLSTNSVHSLNIAGPKLQIVDRDFLYTLMYDVQYTSLDVSELLPSSRIADCGKRILKRSVI